MQNNVYAQNPYKHLYKSHKSFYDTRLLNTKLRREGLGKRKGNVESWGEEGRRAGWGCDVWVILYAHYFGLYVDLLYDYFLSSLSHFFNSIISAPISFSLYFPISPSLFFFFWCSFSSFYCMWWEKLLYAYI